MEFQGHFDQIVDWDNEFYFPEWKLYNDSIISFTNKYKIIDLVWFSNTGNFEVTTYVCKFKYKWIDRSKKTEILTLSEISVRLITISSCSI